MTTDAELRKMAEEDIKRLSPYKPKDINGEEYEWDEGKRCFTRIDEKGFLWKKGINSRVAGYWSYCSNEKGTDRDGVPVKCNAPHFVFIFENGEEKKCDDCGKTYKIVIKVK